MLKRTWQKMRLLALTGTVAVLAVGGCAVEEWSLAVGPLFSHPLTFLGVDLDFANGSEVVVPLFRLF